MYCIRLVLLMCIVVVIILSHRHIDGSNIKERIKREKVEALTD